MFNRQMRSALTALTAAGVMVCSVGSVLSQDRLTPVKLTVIAPGTNYAQFSLAKSEGIFAKNGLDVEFIKVDTANSGIASAISGSAQFAFTGPNVVDAAASGIPIVAIYSLANVSIAQVCGHESIKSAKDLIGKSVAVPNRGSAPDVTFRIWLQNQGVKEDQLTIRNINAGTPAVMAAAASGAVQAFALNPPRCYLNAKSGYHVLADLGSTGMAYFNAGVAVSRDYLEKNRDVVRRFVRSLDDARKLFKQNREVAFRAIADQDKVTDSTVSDQVWNFYKKYWADPPAVSQEAMLQAIKYSSSERTRKEGPRMVSKMFDNSVVEEVTKK